MKGKTVIIKKDIHQKLKEYCRENELKINEYINNLINNHLSFTLESKSVLPLVLKDSKGEIVETIICNDISPEYKNNLPKSLTLLRNSKGSSGFIANYKQI